MQNLARLLPIDPVALGWMICHSLWQITILWCVLLIVDRSAGRADVRLRYALACATLCLAFVTTGATAAIYWGLDSWAGASAAVEPPILSHGLHDLFDVRPTRMDSVVRAYGPYLSWAGICWLVILGFRGLGVVIAAIWLPITVKRQSEPFLAYDGTWTALCHRLVPDRPVSIRRSSQTASPFTVGWLRPIIVMPTVVLTGLPTSHVEAVLAHELAHIRRRDYAVNLLQAIGEAIFFYHPCLHFISRRIRQLREECCDDLAVEAIGGARASYIDALLAVEDLQPSARLALGADGGSLIQRVRRLARPILPTDPRVIVRAAGGTAVLLGVLFLSGTYSAYGYVAQQQMIEDATSVPLSKAVYDALEAHGSNTKLVEVMQGFGPKKRTARLTDEDISKLLDAMEGGVPHDLLLRASVSSFGLESILKTRPSSSWRGGNALRWGEVAAELFDSARSRADPDLQHRLTRAALLIAAQERLGPPGGNLQRILIDPEFSRLSGLPKTTTYHLRMVLSAHIVSFNAASPATMEWLRSTDDSPPPLPVEQAVRRYPLVAWNAAHVVAEFEPESRRRRVLVDLLDGAAHPAGPALATELRSGRVWHHSSSTSISITPSQGPSK